MRRVLPRDFAWAKNVVAFDPPADHHAKNRQSMRYFVYVLRSTVAERLYIGSSAEPDARLKSHNFGRVRSTKAWRPWERVLLEQYPDRATAEKREDYLKSGWARMELALLLERWQSG
jgi:putative endonuclease